MELELFVPAKHVLHQVGGEEQHVLVDGFRFLERHLILRGIKAVKIAEDPAKSVADVAIVIGDAPH